MRQNTKRGFTLIELLIVVAIIGLLASIVLIGLQGTRRGARDARRGADMHTVQLALEGYFSRCSRYPMNGLDCNDPSTTGSRGIQLWSSQLGAEMFDERIISSQDQLPQDPLGYDELDPRSYQAVVVDEYESGGAGLTFPYYLLRAVMEEPENRLVANDIDGDVLGGVYSFPNGFGVSNGCGGPPAEIEYCVESQQ